MLQQPRWEPALQRWALVLHLVRAALLELGEFDASAGGALALELAAATASQERHRRLHSYADRQLGQGMGRIC